MLRRKVRDLRWWAFNVPTGVETDPYESMRIGLDPNLEETVVLFLEARKIIKVRRFGQLALGIVTPAVVSASKDQGRASRLFGHRVCAMSANVVKATKNFVLAHYQEERKACDTESEVVSRLLEAGSVCHTEP